MAGQIDPIMMLDDVAIVPSTEAFRALNRGVLERALKSRSLPSKSLDIETRVAMTIVAAMGSNETDGKQLAAACDTCKILLKNMKTPATPEIWMQIFNASTVLFERGKAKAGHGILKQLLSVLLPSPYKMSIEEAVLPRSLDILLTNNLSHSLVFHVSVLDQFLNYAFSLERFVQMVVDALIRVDRLWILHLDQFRLSKVAQDGLSTLSHKPAAHDFHGNRFQGIVHAFIATLFVSAIHTDSPSAIAHLLQSFMSKLEARIAPKDFSAQSSCFSLLQDTLISHPECFDRFTVHIFPVLHSTFSDGFASLLVQRPDLEQHKELTDEIILFRLTVIGYLSRVGDIEFQSDLEQTIETAFGATGYLGRDGNSIIRSLLQHTNAKFRIQTTGLLFALKTKHGISQQIFSLAKHSLSYIHNLHDPKLRNDAFPIIRQMISCIAAECNRADMGNLRSVAEPSRREQNYVDFIRWYLSFLNLELYPTTSYPRHVSALKVLLYMMDSLCRNPGRQRTDNFAPKKSGYFLMREIIRIPFQWALFDLLFDPYEEIRQLASRTLRYYLRFFMVIQVENSGLAIPLQHWAQKLSDEPLISRPKNPDVPVRMEKIEDDLKYPESTDPGLEFTFWRNAIHSHGRLASQTNRADHADGFGRLTELLSLLVSGKLEIAQASSNSVDIVSPGDKYECAVIDSIIRSLEIALANSRGTLNAPLEDFPLHGCLVGLCHCLAHVSAQHCILDGSDGSGSLAQKIVSMCEKIWDAVRDQLCIDAPERETEELEDGDILSGPKDMLSYSWRALHDSSHVLHALLSTKCFLLDISGFSSSFKVFRKVGTLLMEQMTLLRHRGAFSSVARSFELFCQCCTASQQEQSNDLLMQLFEVGKARMVRMDDKITRRSAGFPAFVSAILIAKDEGFFKEVMGDFSHQALQFDRKVSGDQRASLPQVHYLNCLREVYLTSQLRQWSTHWLETGLNLASKCIVSEIWAIRNCGLMLLKAITDRLSRPRRSHHAHDSGSYEEESDIPMERSFTVGILVLRLLTQEVEDTSNQPWDALPRPEMFKRFLASKAEMHRRRPKESLNTDPETLCLSLNIIGRITFEPEDAIMVQTLISRSFAYKDWLVRDLAARTYSKIANTTVTPEGHPIGQLALACNDSSDANEVHGILLATRYIFRKCSLRCNHHELRLVIQQIRGALLELSLRLFNHGAHPAVHGAFLDLVNDYLKLTMFDHEKAAFLSDNAFGDVIQLTLSMTLPMQQSKTFSLLLRATSLTRWLLFLLKRTYENSSPEMSQAFHGIHPDALTCVDPDAVRYTILELSDIHVKAPETSMALILLHLASVRNVESLDVQALAIRRLAALLGSMSNSDSGDLQAETFSEIRDFVQANNLTSHQPRELWTAHICLQAAVFKHDQVTKTLLACTPKECRFCTYSSHLRDAIDDEIDLPTRQAGLESLTYLEHALASNIHSLPSNHRTSTILALYDLLTDDDEDIRDGAASIASTIYSHSQTTTTTTTDPSSSSTAAAATQPLPLTAAAVAPKLLLCLARQHHDSELRQTAIQRLFVVPSFERAVETVARARQRNALFEEEKQNLYRDEVGEARVWAEVLVATSSPPPLAPPTSLSESTRAAIAGLAYLLEHKGLVVGTLRIDPEILVLCIRLIFMSEVLVRWRGGGKEEEEEDGELRRLLRETREMLGKRWVLPPQLGGSEEEEKEEEEEEDDV